MLGILEAKEKQIDLTPAWRRYAALLTKPKPSEKEKAEFSELLGKLNITPTLARLHAAVLDNDLPLADLIKSEGKVRAAELVAQKANEAARQRRIDLICTTQRELQNNDYPESREYNAVRDEVQKIMAANTSRAALHSVFPQLFGLSPGSKQAVFSEADFPVMIQNKMRELKIRFSDL